MTYSGRDSKKHRQKGGKKPRPGEVSRATLATSVLLVVAACAPLPNFTSSARFPVALVIRHLNCEMKHAFIDEKEKAPSWFDVDKWSVSTQITLKADSEIDAGVGYDHKYNRSLTKLVDLPLGADVNQHGHRDTLIGYSNNLENLRKLDCSNEQKVVESLGWHPLTGNLGIAQWRDKIFLAYDDFARPDSLSYANQFRLVIDANSSPSLKLISVTNSAKASASITNEDTLSVAFAKIKTPPAAKPIAVYIVQKPSPPAPPGAAPQPPKTTITIVPQAAPKVPRNEVDPYTQQRLDQIQNQGVIQRALPDCRVSGLC
ncbi:hypothetical protein FJW07_31285 [Mesorhizobium sp. B3-1-9]|uniref:hypothetical protein n=1 Tax=Mesorhizobium sp. B3-1-9 TaxID=2589892 RepID=UPI00112EE7A4|nr:hypothetical protein [Mesorhizobium sp. B3-1-9]TPI27756.1 hypothetical protein FJW07_31285 [Mesorhizobium sp. B3-1-9]